MRSVWQLLLLNPAAKLIRYACSAVPCVLQMYSEEGHLGQVAGEDLDEGFLGVLADAIQQEQRRQLLARRRLQVEESFAFRHCTTSKEQAQTCMSVA